MTLKFVIVKKLQCQLFKIIKLIVIYIKYTHLLQINCRFLIYNFYQLKMTWHWENNFLMYLKKNLLFFLSKIEFSWCHTNHFSPNKNWFLPNYNYNIFGNFFKTYIWNFFFEQPKDKLDFNTLITIPIVINNDFLFKNLNYFYKIWGYERYLKQLLVSTESDLLRRNNFFHDFLWCLYSMSFFYYVLKNNKNIKKIFSIIFW